MWEPRLRGQEGHYHLLHVYYLLGTCFTCIDCSHLLSPKEKVRMAQALKGVPSTCFPCHQRSVVGKDYSVRHEKPVVQQAYDFKQATSFHWASVWHMRAQSHLTLCDPVDCSLPGSSVHGVFQARILEWVAIPFSRGSARSRNQTRVSCISCIGRQILYHCIIWEAHGLLTT